MDAAPSYPCPRCTAQAPVAGAALVEVAPQQLRCAVCEGLFVMRPAVLAVLDGKRPVTRSAPVGGSPYRSAPLEHAAEPSGPEAVRYLRCPVCAGVMNRVGVSVDVIGDMCLRHGLWLDGNEVEMAQVHRRRGRHDTALDALFGHERDR